jgi:hypothetical protein
MRHNGSGGLLRYLLPAILGLSLSCAPRPATEGAASQGAATAETPAPSPATPPARPFPEGVQRGVCYAHAWLKPEAGYGTQTDAETLARLKALGVEWVSITPFGFQRDKNSTELGTSARFKDGESDERVAAAALAAHKLGMKVLLKPHIWVGDNSWCGAITPRDWGAWFRSYQEVVEHYAALAEEIKADGFVMGNELGTATRADPEAFRRLIRAARGRYSGPIAYAANWDEAARIPFWGDLDAIGVSAYWPLTKKRAATEEELYEGALAIERELAALAEKTGRPIILTEIGYRSEEDAGMNPAAWPGAKPVDHEAQVRAYRAIFRALWGRPYLKGLYLWKVMSDGTHDEEGPGGFSPLGKPAEEILKRYFSAAG